ncbi:MAG: peptidoglycan DD-metalloendopeptidase family protein [Bacteroidales bacterium]|nr:peptidoglycan DD-metalloendopeptidase family protein [Bacteroidales bacterium]
MRIKYNLLFYILPLLVLALFALALVFSGSGKPSECNIYTLDEDVFVYEPVIELDEFGFPVDGYRVEQGVVGPRQTLSHILTGLHFNPREINLIARSMQEVFNPRGIRRGNNYYTYFAGDSTDMLQYFVYEINDLDYVLLDFRDSLVVSPGRKEVVSHDRKAAGVIRSSLWNTMMEQGLRPDLVNHMAGIMAWSVDFYRIEAGDRFRVLYTEDFVGDRSVGVSRIDAVHFVHRGREVEAYRFHSDTISGYYDGEGNNVRKTFLRAPLEFGRISSRFSHSRRHPIHGDRRPHYGTDYAAPHGTPILAVGDGVVTQASYTRGNGNFVRIRHNAVYETQYLHMSRFASGIRPGTRVTQGQVIGYVGSTGTATGPHVCFRFWKNGRQVDHLRLEFPSGDPLPEAYMDEFLKVRDSKRALLNSIPLDDTAAL